MALHGTLLGLLCAFVGLTPIALALSPREEAYARDLLARLDRGGLEAGDVREIRVDTDPNGAVLGEYPKVGGPEANPMQAVADQGNGLAVDLGDGLELRRLQFDSAGGAQRFLAQLKAREVGAPVLAQVRGDQVVLLTGEALTDPALARRLLDAAWNGLPAPAEADATLTDLGRGNRVLTTRLADGPVRDLITDRYEKARRVSRSPLNIGKSGIYEEGPGALVIGDEGTKQEHLRVDGDGASQWSTNPDDEALMREHLGVHGGHPQPRKAARGLRGALGGLGR